MVRVIPNEKNVNIGKLEVQINLTAKVYRGTDEEVGMLDDVSYGNGITFCKGIDKDEQSYSNYYIVFEESESEKITDQQIQNIIENL